MAIGTKNIKTDEATTGGGLKPILSPNNHEITILSIELQSDKNSEKFGNKLKLLVLTKPIEGFKGAAINKAKPELGNYQGQIGYVSYSRWNFRNDVTPNGTEIFRDDELLKAIKTICDELKITKWFDDADGKYETMEEFITAFSNEAPFKGIYFHSCIYGREYLNGTYVNHDLYFPRADRNLGKPFSLNKEKVITFFESAGIERLKPKADQVTQKSEPIELKKAELPSQDLVDKAVESTKEQRNLDFLNSLNAPAKEEPVRPKVTSAAEASFMNEGKSKIPTPFTDEINKESEKSSDIVKDDGSKLPWED